MNEDKITKQPKLYQSISLTRAKKLANALTGFLESNNLVIEIAGKKYVPVEGWQFTGTQLNLTDVVQSCDPVESTIDKEIKYKAMVEVINQNGTVISRGFAWCSNQENKKKGFEEYAVASMAQTRAIGKAYRNILSWIVKLGGYEPMPAEEANKDVLEKDLSKLKQKVAKKLIDSGITESQDMIRQIESVIGKASIDTIDEAYKILESLNEDEDS